MRASVFQGLLDANVHSIPFTAQNHQVTAAHLGTAEYPDTRLVLHASSGGSHPSTCRHLTAADGQAGGETERLMRDCSVAQALRSVPAVAHVLVCLDCHDLNEDLKVLSVLMREASVAAEVVQRATKDAARATGAGVVVRPREVLHFRRQVGLSGSTEHAAVVRGRSDSCPDPALASWWDSQLARWWAQAETLRVSCRDVVPGWDDPLCYVVPHDALWTVPDGTLTRWLAGAEVAAYAPNPLLPFAALPVFEVPQRAVGYTELAGWAHLGPVAAGPPVTDRVHAYQALRETSQHTDQDVVNAMTMALV